MFEMGMMVSNSHINENKQMKVTKIIDAIQDIEGIHIEKLGAFTNYINEENLGIFLTYRQIDIIKKPEFNSKINIKTYPYNTNSIGGWRQIYLTSDQDEMLVKSVAFGAFVDLKSGLPKRIPRAVAKSINDYEADPNMQVLPRKIMIDNFEFKEVKQVLVEKSNIDRYRHLNNAYYVEFAANTLKDINKYNRIRAEYLKPFVENDIIHLAISNEINDEVIVTLSNNKGEVYAIVAFSYVKAMK